MQHKLIIKIFRNCIKPKQGNAVFLINYNKYKMVSIVNNSAFHFLTYVTVTFEEKFCCEKNLWSFITLTLTCKEPKFHSSSSEEKDNKTVDVFSGIPISHYRFLSCQEFINKQSYQLTGYICYVLSLQT